MGNVDDIANELSGTEHKAFCDLGKNGYSTNDERDMLVNETAKEIGRLIDEHGLSAKDITGPHVLRSLEDDNAHIAIDAISKVVGQPLEY